MNSRANSERGEILEQLPPACWNAGMPVCRVKILENAPKMTALSVNPAVESVRYSPRRKVMATPSPGAVTELLRAWSDGDDGALEQLMPLVEAELRRLARGYMRRERRGHTLQTTALVNEAFLRLTDARHVRWQDRAHFLGISARLMRRVLVDHARARGYRKRGGGAQRVTLDEGLVTSPEPGIGRGGARSRPGGIGDGRRSEEPDHRIAVLRRLERRGDGGGAPRVARHRQTRLATGETLAAS